MHRDPWKVAGEQVAAGSVRQVAADVGDDEILGARPGTRRGRRRNLPCAAQGTAMRSNDVPRVGSQVENPVANASIAASSLRAMPRTLRDMRRRAWRVKSSAMRYGRLSLGVALAHEGVGTRETRTGRRTGRWRSAMRFCACCCSTTALPCFFSSASAAGTAPARTSRTHPPRRSAGATRAGCGRCPRRWPRGAAARVAGEHAEALIGSLKKIADGVDFRQALLPPDLLQARQGDVQAQDLVGALEDGQDACIAGDLLVRNSRMKPLPAAISSASCAARWIASLAKTFADGRLHRNSR